MIEAMFSMVFGFLWYMRGYILIAVVVLLVMAWIGGGAGKGGDGPYHGRMIDGGDF